MTMSQALTSATGVQIKQLFVGSALFLFDALAARMHSKEGTQNIAWSFSSSKDGRPFSRRASLEKRARAPVVCSSAVKHSSQQRTTLAFR